MNETNTGKRGASRTYSDMAIATMSTLGSVMRLPGRQTEGFVDSLYRLMDVDLPVPDHTTVSRRLRKLSVSLPIIEGKGDRHVVVDSTGIKVYGEGEWKVRMHGYSKRRTWRKLHLGIDESTGEILATVVSTNNVSDDEALGDVIDVNDVFYALKPFCIRKFRDCYFYCTNFAPIYVRTIPRCYGWRLFE